MGTPALGVDDALRDALAILVRQLLDELVVLQQHGTSRPRGERVLVVGNGTAPGGG